MNAFPHYNLFMAEYNSEITIVLTSVISLPV